MGVFLKGVNGEPLARTALSSTARATARRKFPQLVTPREVATKAVTAFVTRRLAAGFVVTSTTGVRSVTPSSTPYGSDELSVGH